MKKNIHSQEAVLPVWMVFSICLLAVPDTATTGTAPLTRLLVLSAAWVFEVYKGWRDVDGVDIVHE